MAICPLDRVGLVRTSSTADRSGPWMGARSVDLRGLFMSCLLDVWIPLLVLWLLLLLWMVAS